jgi:hypothetical protein
MRPLYVNAALAARTTVLAASMLVIGLLGCGDEPSTVDNGPIRWSNFSQRSLELPLPQQGDTFAPLHPHELLGNALPIPPLTQGKLLSAIERMRWNLEREGFRSVDPTLEAPRWRIVALSAERGDGGMRWPCAANQLFGDWPWPWDLCDAFSTVLRQSLRGEEEFVFVGLLDTKAREFALVTGACLTSNAPRKWSSEIRDAVDRLFRNFEFWRNNEI